MPPAGDEFCRLDDVHQGQEHENCSERPGAFVPWPCHRPLQAPHENRKPSIARKDAEPRQRAEHRRQQHQRGAQIVAAARVDRMVKPQPIDGKPGQDDGRSIEKSPVRREPRKQQEQNAVGGQHRKQDNDHANPKDAEIEEVQRCPREHFGIVIIGWKQQLHGSRHRHDSAESRRGAQERCIAQAAGRQCHDDRERQHQRPFVRECECHHHGENERRASGCLPGGVANRERRPEQGVRQPHLGRKAEYQRTKQGCRTACIDEDDATAGAVGDEGADQARKRGDIE